MLVALYGDDRFGPPEGLDKLTAILTKFRSTNTRYTTELDHVKNAATFNKRLNPLRDLLAVKRPVCQIFFSMGRVMNDHFPPRTIICSISSIPRTRRAALAGLLKRYLVSVNAW